jgi:hypothetical protein
MIETNESATAGATTAPPGPEVLDQVSARDEYWRQVVAEVKADPRHATLFDPNTWAGPGSDPSWNELGERGRTAQILFSSGLRSKARRFADCGRVAFRLICSNEPEQHGFYTPFNCGLRFCQQCAPKIFRQLFSKYVRALAAYVSGRAGEEGYTLAHFDFTIRASGDVPTPQEVRAFNKAIRKVLKRAIPKKTDFGALWCDEFGHEKPHKHPGRKARGWNLHAHGIYYGPYLNWRKVRSAWKRATKGSTGFRIKEEKNWRKDPPRGVKKALGHMLKYVSKPPAETPERIAALEVAFAGVRRVHSVGVFYNLKKITKQEDAERPAASDDRCPICGGAFYIPRWPPRAISDLRYEGLRDLETVKRQMARARVFGGGP